MSTEQKQEPVQLAWYGRAGDWLKKNQGDIALVVGFVLVALISFGVGYLSAPGVSGNPLEIEERGTERVTGEQATSSRAENGQGISGQADESPEKGMMVASKNSKIYHWPWCAPATKIKPENEVWFKSESEAQAGGRTRCADFERLAPAGYIKQ
jgi:hypothetical protein